VLDLDAYIDDIQERESDLKQDALIREAFENGIDLRDYAASIEKDLEVVEEGHILDCKLKIICLKF
jgi:hypothetical protein